MSNTINIPGCTTTHYLQVTNPLVYLLKQAVYKANNESITIGSALNSLLQSSMMLSNNGKFCCPDCIDNKAFYFLGNIQDFISVITALGLNAAATSTKVLPCCVSKNLLGDGMIQYNDLFVTPTVDKTPACCKTEFSTALQELFNRSSSSTTGNTLEVSSFGNKSGIQIMLDFFDTLDPVLSASDYNEIITVLDTVGNSIVIKCVGCDIFIGSSANFITYGQQIGFVTNY